MSQVDTAAVGLAAQVVPAVEESLETGLQRHLTRVQDVSNVLQHFTADASRLQVQVTALKRQLTDLTSAVSTKGALLASLEVEIEKVQNERDTLRHEQATRLQAEEWWFEREAAHSGGSPRMARDEKGRAIRRAHSEMMEREKLAERIQEMEREHNDRIEEERTIAAGLRERVGKLDARMREREERIRELEQADMTAKAKWEIYRTDAEGREARLRSEWNDMKAALDASNRERSASALSPRTLRTITPNIPVTPPRPSFSSIETSSSHKSQTTPTASLAMRYAKLEEKYADLWKSYRELREMFENDRRCFKEYKALQLARDKVHKQKKKEKKLRASGRSSGSRKGSGTPQNTAMSAVPPPAAAAQDGEEEEVEYESTEVRVARERTEARRENPPTAPAPEVSVKQTTTAPLPRDHTDQTPQPRPVERQLSTELRNIQVSESRQLRRQPSLGQNTTPLPANRQLGRTPSLDPQKRIEASRTTPWLGNTTRRLGPTTSKGNVLDDLGQDMMATPVQRSTAGPSKPLLVRDRGDPTSLRRTALAASAAQPESTPVAIPPQAESSRKRALDMENLTPAEKATARKKLSKLSTSEKREVYAEYKGKGRYLPPAEVRKDVHEEYEIDPRQNEGVKHAFHDVKRGREARKAMHGGDCECCSGYYEAVGPLPVYNPAPKWNDTAETKDHEAAIREHQQKVSRHRETWTKPPTPPGYWSIAFPTTQEVARQNEDADKMEAEREARIRKEAAQKDGKWKKKA